MSQSFSDRDAIPGQRNAGLEQVLPGKTAMPPMGQLVATELPGNGY